MTELASWTIERLLAWTTDYFAKSGSETPRLDAEILLAHAMHCPRIGLYTKFKEEPSAPERQAFRELVRRRGEGRPVAYLVGQREFFSLPFEVTPSVLVPRPETEHLVIAVLDMVRRQLAEQPRVRIADVGTGSGNIAIALAKHIDHADVVAIDIDPAALAVAQSNARRLGVADRIELVTSDLFDEIAATARFDIVVSNPPYVGSDDAELLDQNVRRFEPQVALMSGGPKGSEVIARLVPQAAARLRPGGWLALEISPMIRDDTVALIKDTGAFAPATVTKDLAGLDRVVTARRLE
jgi:release factor glutamine methyltransferase